MGAVYPITLKGEYVTKNLLTALESILPVDLYRLVLKSQDPNEHQPRTMKTPLHFMALICNNLQLFRDMISLGANADLQDANGMTPLSLAVQSQNNTAVIDLLIAAGADVNMADYYRFTPLIKASMGKSKHQVVELLLRAGADVHYVDATGRTAIDWAGDKHTRELLVQAGCRPGPQVPTFP